MKKVFLLIVLVFCIIVCPVFADEGIPEEGNQNENSINMEEVINILVIFLVLSVVFEVALTPIFNWRVFLSYCHEKGCKTPITVILALLVFWGYDLDILTDLINVLKPNAKIAGPKIGGQVLTALLIAGGSSGIFQIFTKLKIRDPGQINIKAAEARTKRIAKEEEGKSEKKDEVAGARDV